MTLDDAIQEACLSVGIKPPKAHREGRWIKTDTQSGKNGKGDGRIIVDETKVVAWNWQTQQQATVWLKDRKSLTVEERREFARARAKEEADKRARAENAARIASEIVSGSTLATHPYLASKGFRDEKVPTISADHLRKHGAYLVAGDRAIVMPARIGHRITSLQIIWEDGTKKFLAGGEIGGASHRIAKGRDVTWLCEGLATGLSLRAALKGLNRSDTVLCCFSASNVLAVSRSIKDRCFIAADHDAIPKLDPFNGFGTGEHYAKASGKLYFMPPEIGEDLNDLHMRQNIFAVQKLIAMFLRGAR